MRTFCHESVMTSESMPTPVTYNFTIKISFLYGKHDDYLTKPSDMMCSTTLLNNQMSLSDYGNPLHDVLQEDGVGMKLSDHESDKNPSMDTDSSTPVLYGDKEKMKSKSLKTRADKKKRRREDEWEVGESIRWLAEVVVRSEQARMDTMREVEKMRAEAEAKSGEIDLKRTEILANTQLEIARLFAGVGKGIDSSLRIGRS